MIPLHTVHDGRCSCGHPECTKQGKHPRIDDWGDTASVSPEQVAEWWYQWPDSNVGILCGAPSGLVVLDIDPRNGGDSSLEELQAERGALPETLEVVTGSGGRHFYFRHPGGKVKSNKKIRPGIDIQADGALVVAPPSLHVSGNRYQWVDPKAGISAAPPLPAKVNGTAAPTVEGSVLEGSRNSTLTSVAGSMRRRGMTVSEMLPSLLEFNAGRCKPPLPETEVEGIAASVGEYEPGESKPAPVAVPPRQPWPVVTLAQIIAKNPQPEPYLIEGILRRKQVFVLAGMEGAGKAAVLQELAVAACTGGRWLSHPTTPCRVGLLTLEMSEAETLIRHRALEHPNAAGALHVLTGDMIGTDVIDICDPESGDLESVIAWVKATGGLDMLIMDPKGNLYPGAEDRLGHAAFNRSISRIRYECGVAVALASHVPKLLPKEATHFARGDTTFTGAAHAVFVLKMFRGSIELLHAKNRNGPKVAPVFLETSKAGDPQFPLTTRDAPLDSTKGRQANLDALKAAFPAEWTPPSTVRQASGLKVADSTFKSYFDELLETGFAETKDHGRATKYRRTIGRLDNPADYPADYGELDIAQ